MGCSSRTIYVRISETFYFNWRTFLHLQLPLESSQMGKVKLASKIKLCSPADGLVPSGCLTVSLQNCYFDVMEPFSEKGNIDMLKRSGFVDISGVFQYLCFRGYLCIK